MTRLAAYEKSEGSKNNSIGTYFRSDYISLQLLGAIVSSSIVFLIVVGLYVFCNLDVLLADIYNMDLITIVKQTVIYYLVFVGGYTLISYIVYALRYKKAKKRLRVYFNNLKRLQVLYQKERKEKARRDSVTRSKRMD